jgi:flagellar biosynthetic protein FliQ
MDDAVVLDLLRSAFVITLLSGGPLLGVMLLIGVAVSILQALTQVQEPTLTFLPKMIGAGLVCLVGGAWMLEQVIRFTTQLFGNLALYAR